MAHPVIGTQAICANFFANACPPPPTFELDLTNWFEKPKPNPLPLPKTPSGERLKVLHISDFHLDARKLALICTSLSLLGTGV